MLTSLTQAAIAVLADIENGKTDSRTAQYALLTHMLSHLLSQLEFAGLIRLLPDQSRGVLTSYQLTRPSSKISLLDLLQAIGEHLNCNTPISEACYAYYGNAARKLGVINQVTRSCLSEIRLSDF